ncbi:MAG: DnaA/Hda family protein, partial [Planctomycetales bacterium]
MIPALLSSIADKVGKDQFTVWFEKSARVTLNDRTLIVEVVSRFVQERIRRNYMPMTRLACQEVLGWIPEIQVQIQEPVEQETVDREVGDRDSSTKSSKPTTEPQRSSPSRPATKTGRRSFASLETLVVGSSNRLAATSAEMIIERPANLNPLFFFGPTGVGKTHLLEAVWTGFKKTRRHVKALYLSSEKFTTEFVGAVHGGLPSFRRKYRSLELLLLDDVHFFRGKQATLVELLHTVDHLIQEGKQVVLSADRPPNELTELGAELTTRLAGGMMCALESPDYPMRKTIVERLSGRMQLEIPQDVQEFIAQRFTSHVRELQGALNQLQAHHRATGEPVRLSS